MAININIKEFKEFLTNCVKLLDYKKDNLFNDSIFIKSVSGEIVFIVISPDFENYLEIKTGLKCELDRLICVSASVFKGVVLTIIDGTETTLMLEKNNINIKTDMSDIKIPLKNVDDIPAIPNLKEEVFIEIKKEDFLNGLNATLFAVSKSLIRQEFTGVNIENKSGLLYFVSTDTFRLVENVEKIENNKNFSVILPKNSIIKIISLLQNESSENILLRKMDSGFIINTDKYEIYSQIINKPFPEYSSLFPKEFECESIVLKDDIQNTLKKTNFIQNKSNECKLIINKDSISVQVDDSEGSFFKDTIKAKNTKNGLEFNFNYKYLNEIISHNQSQHINLRFSKSGQLTISPVGGEKNKAILMPINN